MFYSRLIELKYIDPATVQYHAQGGNICLAFMFCMWELIENLSCTDNAGFLRWIRFCSMTDPGHVLTTTFDI